MSAFSTPESVAIFTAAAALAGALGYFRAAAARKGRVERAEQALRRAEQTVQQQRSAAAELEARWLALEARCERIAHSLVEIPEIAQQLAASRKLREVPENVLEFVAVVFQPRYSAYYRASRDTLVAVAVRGESGIEVGHRVRVGEGVVGRAAQTQLPFAAEDLRIDGGAPQAYRDAGLPEAGFSWCLPVTSDRQTFGVILVGPCDEATPLAKETGRTIALVASVVLARMQVLNEQNRLAQTDGLTGLWNRTQLFAQTRELLKALPRTGSLGIFLFDIDHFKHYNDTNGHLAGDDLLRALSQLLRERTREDELVGRYGGEEFLVVIPNVDREQALRAAERIRSMIAATPFPHAERQPGGCVSISGGVSVAPLDGDDLETLIKRADRALYAAKHAGRNRVSSDAVLELDPGSEAKRIGTAVAAALLDDISERQREGDA